MRVVLFVAACLWPHLVFLAGIPCFSKLKDGSPARFLLGACMCSIAWFGVLVILFFRQGIHEMEWHRENRGLPLTEQGMVELGDYPNVFAGWVLFGWIPVLIGYAMARRVARPRDKM